jgi:hypothetical protein
LAYLRDFICHVTQCHMLSISSYATVHFNTSCCTVRISFCSDIGQSRKIHVTANGTSLLAWAGCLRPVWLDEKSVSTIPRRSCVAGWDCHAGIPLVGMVTWIFPTQSLPRAKAHVALRVRCLIFVSDFKQNWNVPANFRKTSHIQI